MNVLSLFDGMSCGQIALERANIRVKKYYASEIDKYAIAIAKKNYPNTIHLGDVKTIDTKSLDEIDLLIGGSPCQGFSFAGKQLKFDDPRSQLFFEFLRILKECKPKYFLLENVIMSDECKQIITNYLKEQPIEIDSALVSAQHRKRLYWTNIPFEMPQDKHILLKDILENGIADLVINQGKHLYRADIKKSHSLMARDYKGFGNQSMTGVRKVYKPLHKSMSTNGMKQVGVANINGNDVLKRVYSGDGKSPSLNAHGGGNTEPKIGEHNCWRKLTPLECERLQTVPDHYTNGVSNTQRYKMLGNGWTVDVVAHILKNIQIKTKPNYNIMKQMDIFNYA